jgi:hypothetical protein
MVLMFAVTCTCAVLKLSLVSNHLHLIVAANGSSTLIIFE